MEEGFNSTWLQKVGSLLVEGCHNSWRVEHAEVWCRVLRWSLQNWQRVYSGWIKTFWTYYLETRKFEVSWLKLRYELQPFVGLEKSIDRRGSLLPAILSQFSIYHRWCFRVNFSYQISLWLAKICDPVHCLLGMRNITTKRIENTKREPLNVCGKRYALIVPMIESLV